MTATRFKYTFNIPHKVTVTTDRPLRHLDTQKLDQAAIYQLAVEVLENKIGEEASTFKFFNLECGPYEQSFEADLMKFLFVIEIFQTAKLANIDGASARVDQAQQQYRQLQEKYYLKFIEAKLWKCGINLGFIHKNIKNTYDKSQPPLLTISLTDDAQQKINLQEIINNLVFAMMKLDMARNDLARARLNVEKLFDMGTTHEEKQSENPAKGTLAQLARQHAANQKKSEFIFQQTRSKVDAVNQCVKEIEFHQKHLYQFAEKLKAVYREQRHAAFFQGLHLQQELQKPDTVLTSSNTAANLT